MVSVRSVASGRAPAAGVPSLPVWRTLPCAAPPFTKPLLRAFFGHDSSRSAALAPKMKGWRGRCGLPEAVRFLPPPFFFALLFNLLSFTGKTQPLTMDTQWITCVFIHSHLGRNRLLDWFRLITVSS